MSTRKIHVAKPRFKRPERIWLTLGVLFLLVSGGTFGLRRYGRRGITRQVMPELTAADHIAANAGDLKGFNVLIITTDTTRADHIGCYGNKRIQTPVIDALAREGILCAQNITPSPSTLPAHSSLHTGLYPVRHGARSNGTFRLDDKITTLAERLSDKGYRTGAVISAFVLDSRFGLDQGFELYHDDLTKGMKYSPHMFRERAAELTNEPATQWLRENGNEPFFLWVHYFDPHAVYLPPEPFRSQYARNPYDGEIAYADSQIGVLLSELDDLGVREKTLVIYTSDHGEGFGEHGEQTHSLLVYDATLHVPLIFHAPARLPKGKVLHRQTCLVDVVPTVLSLLGEEVPAELDGIDLCQRPSSEPRKLLIETIAPMVMHGWAPLVGVRSSESKYILAPTPELYDLQADPRELDNLHDRQPDVVKDLSDQLVVWLGEDPYLSAQSAVDLSNLTTDKETLRRLSALGYVATAQDQSNSEVSRPDPKDRIVHWEQSQRAMNLQALGRPQEAIPMLEQAVAEVPADVFSRSVLASAYRQIGELDRAMTQLQLAAEFSPESANVHLGIAGIHLVRREFDEAEMAITTALDVEPESAQATILEGQIAQARGRIDEALQLFQAAIEADPGTAGPGGYNQIGFLQLHLGRIDEAREAFRSAIRIDALNGEAHSGLANILQLEGRVDEGIAELQVGLRFNPNQPRALSTLASLVSQRGNQKQARKFCERALEMAPKLASALCNLGLIFRRQDNLEQAEEYYKKALEQDPHLDAAHVNLAQLYARQGKNDEAIEQFRLAIQSRPGFPNPIALANVGAYHFNNGEVGRAFRYYRRALRVNPDYALAHKYIASIYVLRDNPARVAHHVRRTLELDPDQAEAPQLRQLLANAEQELEKRQAEQEAAGAADQVDPDPNPSE